MVQIVRKASLPDPSEVIERMGSAAAQATAFRKELESASAARPESLTAARACLARLASSAAELAALVAGRPHGGGITAPEQEEKARDEGWAPALARQCREALDELCFLAPRQVLPSLPGAQEGLAAGAAIPTLRELAMAGNGRAGDRMAAIEQLALQCLQFARMEYDFLYDKSRHLLSIGYNVAERRVDSGYYDLLASEARLCNFVAIAQGQLPQESWFALGRLLTGSDGEPVLLSWSGSMFEYLMPLLVMTIIWWTHREIPGLGLWWWSSLCALAAQSLFFMQAFSPYRGDLAGQPAHHLLPRPDATRHPALLRGAAKLAGIHPLHAGLSADPLLERHLQRQDGPPGAAGLPELHDGGGGNCLAHMAPWLP